MTDMDPFDQHEMFDLQYNQDIMGKKEDHRDDGKSKASVAGTIMKAIKAKETFIKETFTNVNTRSEIFFKFTGYSYKLASAWKLTLSNQKPLLPFQNHYECVVLPKEPRKRGSSNNFFLWMITRTGDYRKIKLNSDVELDMVTTQLSLQYNSIDMKIILSILTKKHYTNLVVSEKCKKCNIIPVEDYSFELCKDLKNERSLRPIDFHKMQWVYKFHLSDKEFEEDNEPLDDEICDHEIIDDETDSEDERN